MGHNPESSEALCGFTGWDIITNSGIVEKVYVIRHSFMQFPLLYCHSYCSISTRVILFGTLNSLFTSEPHLLSTFKSKKQEEECVTVWCLWSLLALVTEELEDFKGFGSYQKLKFPPGNKRENRVGCILFSIFHSKIAFWCLKNITIIYIFHSHAME